MRLFDMSIAALASAAVVLAGCSSSSAVATEPTPVKCQVSLTTPTPMIDAEGGAATVTVSTSPECPWDVSTNTEWLSGLSPASGQGTSTVDIKVAANPLPRVREGEVVVNGSPLRLSQQAAPCRFDLSPDNVTIAAGGGGRELQVSATTGCEWTVTANAPWISFTSPTRGSGNGTVAFLAAPYNGQEQRAATISLGDARASVVQTGVNPVTPPPPDPGPPAPPLPAPTPPLPPPQCSFVVAPGSQSAPAGGGPGTPVTVTAAAGCAWTATSNAAWLTITSGASGVGSGTVAFTVASNGGPARSGTLTVASQTITVNQAAAPACTYSINPSSTTVIALGGTGSFNVTTGAGCSWTASSSAGWLTVVSGASGSGNGSVGYSVAPNLGASRSATITAGGQTFTVTQAALLCTYSITPTSVTVGEKAETGTVSVSTSNGCGWTASSNVNWVTITSGSSGSGNGSVGYSVAELTDNKDRTGTLSIAGRTFTIQQKAK
jgi:hypothetical protein